MSTPLSSTSYDGWQDELWLSVSFVMSDSTQVLLLKKHKILSIYVYILFISRVAKDKYTFDAKGV